MYYTVDQIRNVSNGDPHLAVALAVLLSTTADQIPGLDRDLMGSVAVSMANDAGIMGAGLDPQGVDLVQGNRIVISVPRDRIMEAMDRIGKPTDPA